MTYWSGIWDNMKDIDFQGDTFMWKYYEMLVGDYDFKGKRVLEIGCGTGINSIIMAKLGADVTFVDFSKSALELVEKTLKKFKLKGKLVLKDGLKLDYKDRFDIVHSEGVVEHFIGAERQKILDIHTRAAKRGGKVIIIVPNAKCPPYRLGKGLAELTGTWIHGAEYPYTGNELTERMGMAGLKTNGIVGGEFLFSFGWAFAPIWLSTGNMLERSIKAKAVGGLVKANYNNFFADRWGRVIAALGVKK
jgi:cyclopropane fatty-acyl-phospholipid synthase-like methyltransferase